MKDKDKLEVVRSLLNNAANLNLSKQTLLRISQKVDQYVMEYYRNSSRLEKGGGFSNNNSSEKDKS